MTQYIIDIADSIAFVSERVLDQIGQVPFYMEPVRELVGNLFLKFTYGQSIDPFFDNPFETLIADMTRGASTASLDSAVIEAILAYTNASFTLKIQLTIGQIDVRGYHNVVWCGPTSLILEVVPV